MGPRLLTGILCLVLLPWGAVHAADGSEAVRLYMDDGQLISHPVRLFVTAEVPLGARPCLRLLTRHAISRADPKERDCLAPFVVATGQSREVPAAGQAILTRGTLMVFDLSRFPIPWYKAMVRVDPVLEWGAVAPGAGKGRVGPRQLALATRPVNLGNPVGAYGWTLLVIFSLVVGIDRLCRRRGRAGWEMLTTPAGKLSLAKTQVVLWTLAVGAVVLAYGLIRLEVPQIPESLLALMAMALGTGGISYVKASGRETAPAETIEASRRARPSLCDLLCDVPPGGAGEVLSVARAQMVFWTLLVLLIFVVKSLLDGVIWAVPWEMVGLMGMSQVGYLAPKLAPQGGAKGGKRSKKGAG